MTSWRRLEDVFRLRLQKASWRCLQDVLIKTNMFGLDLRLQKTSSRRLQDVLVKSNIFALAIRLQDVFKTSCKNVFKASSRRPTKMSSRLLQNIFKTSWKTSSRHLQDVLQRYLQDVFKTYHQAKLFLSTRLWKAFKFNTFLRRSFPKTVIYRGICLGNTTSDNFMVSVQNLQER